MADPVRDNIIFWTAYTCGVIIGVICGILWRKYKDWEDK